jgi:hypothetical protein
MFAIVRAALPLFPAVASHGWDQEWDRLKVLKVVHYRLDNGRIRQADGLLVPTHPTHRRSVSGMQHPGRAKAGREKNVSLAPVQDLVNYRVKPFVWVSKRNLQIGGFVVEMK